LPVSLVPPHSDPDRTARPRVRGRGSSPTELVIGLLNNMPDGAVQATERQFLALLDAASESLSVRLVLLSLPGIPRGEAAAAHLHRHYTCVESFFDEGLDGLIVTGREPLSPRLCDEPWWENFVRVLEWARRDTASTIWSCLAAHAAVLHMDGIERVRSQQKYCGIFECSRVSDHPIAAGLPGRYRLPHSRWNGIPEAELVRCGYEVLARAGDAGVDSFLRQEQSLFLFFQGHPEYQPDTLLLEYRRDVIRHLRGEAPNWPGTPVGCFDAAGERALGTIRRDAAASSEEQTLARVAQLFSQAGTENGWHANAAILYRNWLEHIASARAIGEQAKDEVSADIPALPRARPGHPGATAL
jgi:homoserine O-succinyltransferase/O-acetyltransferase